VKITLEENKLPVALENCEVLATRTPAFNLATCRSSGSLRGPN